MLRLTQISAQLPLGKVKVSLAHLWRLSLEKDVTFHLRARRNCPRCAGCLSRTGQVSQLKEAMYGQFRTCLPKSISGQMDVPRAKLHRNHEATSVGSHQSSLDGVADGYSVKFRSAFASVLQLRHLPPRAAREQRLCGTQRPTRHKQFVFRAVHFARRK